MMLLKHLFISTLVAIVGRHCAASPVKKTQPGVLGNNATQTVHWPERRGKKQYRVFIPYWANPANMPVSVFGKRNVFYTSYHMYGVNRGFGRTQFSVDSLGAGGEVLKQYMQRNAKISHWRMSNITDPRLAKGYQWELHWDVRGGRHIPELLKAFAIADMPIDWLPGKNLKSPGRGIMGDGFAARHLNVHPCERRFKVHTNRTFWTPALTLPVGHWHLFADRDACRYHYRQGCNMPWGHCRFDFHDMRPGSRPAPASVPNMWTRGWGAQNVYGVAEEEGDLFGHCDPSDLECLGVAEGRDWSSPLLKPFTGGMGDGSPGPPVIPPDRDLQVEIDHGHLGYRSELWRWLKALWEIPLLHVVWPAVDFTGEGHTYNPYD